VIQIKIDKASIDIPIYDVKQSARHALISSFVGGSVNRNKNLTSVRALDDITLNFKEGDRVGLIGHNGSGKSTLLKLMAGVYEPTKGSVSCTGKLISIFNSNLGLDIDKTGRENIKNIAFLLGMKPKDLELKLGDIIEFCEIGEFIDLPARTYSAGMLVRLGFAVATSLEPEILLLDENIGAGDTRFAERAKKRLDDFYKKTKLLVLASHSDSLIRSLCNKAVLLEHGRLVKFGDVDDILKIYHSRVK